TGSSSVLTLGGNVTSAADAAGNPATIDGAGTLSLGGATRTFTINGPGATAPAPDAIISAVLPRTRSERLTQSGAGTLQLSADESYVGLTTISQGTLLADASSGTTVGAVILNGGTLGGTGSVGSIAPFSSTVGGTVQPGDSDTSPGTLTSTTNA